MENDGWVRPLLSGEKNKELAQSRHRHQLTCYRLGLCSAMPVTSHHINLALSALFRTCPQLRLRIVDRDGELWFRQMPQEVVSFSVTSSVDVDGEIERQISTSFDSTSGPLWRSLWLPRAGCIIAIDTVNESANDARVKNVNTSASDTNKEKSVKGCIYNETSDYTSAKDTLNSSVENETVNFTCSEETVNFTNETKTIDCLNQKNDFKSKCSEKSSLYNGSEKVTNGADCTESTAVGMKEATNGTGTTRDMNGGNESVNCPVVTQNQTFNSTKITNGLSSKTETGANSHWLPELADEYPHTSTLLLTFHHAITDGFTSLKTCEQLLLLLDQAVRGCSVLNCSQQIGEFSDGSETQRLLRDRKEFLDRDPKRKKMIENSIDRITDFRPIFSEAFPVPPELQRNTTLNLVRRLTREQTQKLLLFFHEEKISFNSGFMAMVNLSLVEMLKRRGFKQRIFEISCYTAVNLRRYWKGDSSRSLGCHVGPISLLADTAATSIYQFLEYSHDVQTNMLDYISNYRTLDECLFLDVKRASGCSSLDEFFTRPPKHPQFWYCLTNMGDVSCLLKGEGETVQLGWLSRHISFHRYNSTLIFALHTFRDRLCFTLGYNARSVTKEVAEELSDFVMKLMLDIVSQMS